MDIDVFPNPASVIFRSSNYGISLIVECTRENFIFMAIKHLNLGSRISVPDSASLVATSRDDFVSLWVELNLRYFVFVTL
jgi:hypothetical protein